MKTRWMILAVGLLCGGCSQVLGLKEPSLEAEADGPVPDGPTPDGPMPDGPAPDARPSNLWVFTTNAQLPANFGTAGGARAVADIKCDDMYRAVYAQRGCTRVRAVLQVDNTSDTLSRMEGNYQIPPNQPLLRASDAVKVSEKWADFVNPNVQLLEAVTPIGSSVLFWSGKGVTNDRQCTGWTSVDNAAFADIGDANRRNSWLSSASVRCDDQRPHLLCVCW